MDKATAEAGLDEMAQRCTEGGETAEEAFSAPAEYTTQVATERALPAERARRR